ncbi:MAG: ATP-dependent RNA helicase [Treponemataceae bacterium]|nr:ATP-dependent RNA helicase [Treponemataceae bacterium]HOJ99716.1 ATP-dependent RNA helicase [Termitinemataceae bacterium]HOM23887.1 ATP-dependent RNA helicase [Termitinemataceae bacterium]HPQ00918.1 ATP-dependent RNA helicase [Termitinemataceae bacterium]
MIYTELPVYQHKDRILEGLATNQVIVVESPTGSGKTTQMPVILYEAGYGKYGIIGVTQPRRIAAVSVSEFIARQMGTKIPGLVGYKMRFEDKTSPETVIKIMTDGILLQEMKLDPYLSKYGVLIVDEAHERSLNIDFILGLLKRVLEVRPEFKVIISSATINAQVFSEYFGECPIVKIDAMTYPVTVVYDPPPGGTTTTASDAAEAALLEKIVHIVDRIVSERREGDILVFLPGEKAIKDCIERLETSPVGRALHVLPLYGRLGKDEQERVFDKAPWGKTKVVVATNIAETSVTIDGITTVIDSGLAKLNYYNPRTFTSSLIEVPISKASCNQRKGRAGRTQPGTCYRLYTRKDYDNRPLFTTEEIYRTDLSEVVLRMAELGITNFEEFDFISPPNREGLLGAIETLNLLDALAPDNSLSDIGKMMAQFPLPPRHSRMIVEAIRQYPQVLEETLIAAAFLTTQSPYVLPPGEEMDARRAHHSFRDPAGDFVSYLKLFRAFKEAKNKAKFCDKNYLDEKTMVEIVNVKEQLELIVSDMGIPILSGGPVEEYLCAVGRGLIQFVCVREGRESYRSLTADRISIHPGSVMFRQDPQYIVAGEIVRTTRTYAMSVSPLSPAALHRISPELYDKLVRKTAAATKKKAKEERDFTNRIKILGEIFEIEKIKGAKTVILTWERLAPHLSELNLETAALYRDLRGLVRYQERYTILAGEKLSFILSLLPHLDIEGALHREWPRKRNYSLATDLDALLEVVPLAGTTALWKPGKTDLGFISLFTDGQGTYWFRCSRGFHTAINESIASLESLIDELSEEVDLLKKDRVNQTYRRLSSYLVS